MAKPNLKKLQEENRRLRGLIREMRGWKRLQIHDADAYDDIDIRQAHAYLYKRGWRHEGWVVRGWRHQTMKCDVESEKGKGLQIVIAEHNNFADQTWRLAELVSYLATHLNEGPLKVLMDIRATKPRNLIKPFFKVGDRVRHRFTRAPSEKQRFTINKGELGVVTEVLFEPGKRLTYMVHFDSMSLPVEIECQMDVEMAGILDRVAHAATDE